MRVDRILAGGSNAVIGFGAAEGYLCVTEACRLEV